MSHGLLRPVDHGVHTVGRRRVHWRAAPGRRALPAGCTPDRGPEWGCCSHGPRLPVIPWDPGVHRLVGLVFTLLSWVMGLLGLVEGGLSRRPGDILLVYHRDGDIAPGELMTAQAAPAGGGGQAGRGGRGRAVRSCWRLGLLRSVGAWGLGRRRCCRRLSTLSIWLGGFRHTPQR